jgi:hypothetical protein
MLMFFFPFFFGYENNCCCLLTSFESYIPKSSTSMDKGIMIASKQ